MKTLVKKYIISAIIILVSYFLMNTLLKPDPHVGNFIPLFILRIAFIIIGIALISYAVTKNAKVITNYLFISSLLINLTSIAVLIFSFSAQLSFYVIMAISASVALYQIYLTSEYLKKDVVAVNS